MKDKIQAIAGKSAKTSPLQDFALPTRSLAVIMLFSILVILTVSVLL